MTHASNKKVSATSIRKQLVYDPETGVFRRRGTGKVAGTVLNTGYRSISVHSKQFLAHRLAWLYVHGAWPNVIDHINGDRLDNRLCNLRSVSQSSNMANAGASARSRTGFRGVFLHPNGKYRAQVTRKGKTTSLGYFRRLADAVAAYETAAEKIHERPRRAS